MSEGRRAVQPARRGLSEQDHGGVSQRWCVYDIDLILRLYEHRQGTSLKLGVVNQGSNDYGPVERALDRRHRSRGGGRLGETKVKRA